MARRSRLTKQDPAANVVTAFDGVRDATVATEARQRPTPATVPRVAVPIVLGICAIVIWLASLQNVDLRQMTDLGLISVLPAQYFVALGCLAVGFCVLWRSQWIRSWLPLAYILILLLMLYATAPIVEGTPRFESTYKHLGVAETIERTGTIFPEVDAYFNWPGFFILVAYVTELADAENAFSVAKWAPLIFNLLYLGPSAAASTMSTNPTIWSPSRFVAALSHAVLMPPHPTSTARMLSVNLIAPSFEPCRDNQRRSTGAGGGNP